MDRIIGYGVAAHEGQLFGGINQVINLLVATGLLAMSSAATVLWLKRKPAGSLGAPPIMHSQQYGIIGIVMLVTLGLLLPELGAALLILALANRIFAKFRPT